MYSLLAIVERERVPSRPYEGLVYMLCVCVCFGGSSNPVIAPSIRRTTKYSLQVDSNRCVPIFAGMQACMSIRRKEERKKGRKEERKKGRKEERNESDDTRHCIVGCLMQCVCLFYSSESATFRHVCPCCVCQGLVCRPIYIYIYLCGCVSVCIDRVKYSSRSS
jgi:hypothetical protein